MKSGKAGDGLLRLFGSAAGRAHGVINLDLLERDGHSQRAVGLIALDTHGGPRSSYGHLVGKDAARREGQEYVHVGAFRDRHLGEEKNTLGVNVSGNANQFLAVGCSRDGPPYGKTGGTPTLRLVRQTSPGAAREL